MIEKEMFIKNGAVIRADDVYLDPRDATIEAQAAENERLREALRMIAMGEVPPSVWPDLAVRYEKFARAALGETK
jgi:hypothetical protein